ncbi:MAG: 4-hydroxythreonine-4-phosphate dehydrogenase PdxA [Rubrivivax sp.]|jgi:4-hydroxythreonine-4-phosphate dehydrogenase|nr:4-hydroxythreonine-4-phosphate dehydrogenase PdxA [Rubrivivax sp.]
MTTPPPVSARPLLIAMGDPVGIGPECIVRAFCRGQLQDAVVVGSVQALRRAGQAAGCRPVIASLSPHGGRALAEGWLNLPAGCLPVIEPEGLPPDLASLPWGQTDARAGRASARCIEWAVERLLDGQGSALVTAPIQKSAWAAAGIHFPGHTEMLQALCTRPGLSPPDVRMMLTNGELSVVLVTIHQSLRSAIDALSVQGILQTLRIVQDAAKRQGLGQPRIAVAGLNPHAGEGGLFGDEEGRLIAPAIEAARAEGIKASGPYPPDTVFMKARHTAERPGAFDVVVAMTHDHGLIPVKYLGVEHGVNVTLGLPLVRTSPDHGTAFDIAGQGLADPRSLEAAVAWARRAASRSALE